jgi:hypothetical protein
VDGAGEDALADNMRFQAAARGLDFRELRHGLSLDRALL